MNQPLVSVVLPVYNVEAYLDRCVRSVVNQTYGNLQILLVDDGSPDRCPELCDAWAEKDPRIQVIHKENAGLGMARNTGIEHAAGDYICFFDSDDYIEPDTIEKTWDLARRDGSEIVLFGHRIQNREGQLTREVVPCPPRWIYSGSQVQEELLPRLVAPDTATGERSNLSLSACMCLFSMELIRRANWRFVSEREIISEDVYSLLVLYRHVRQVSILPQALYVYCENPASLTRTYRPDRYQRICRFYTASVELCRRLDYSPEVIRRLDYPFLSFTIGALKMLVRAAVPLPEKLRAFRRILRDDTLQEVLRETDLRRETPARKALLLGIRGRHTLLCYCMVRAKA